MFAARKGPQLSERKRGVIASMNVLGSSYREIAAAVQCSKSTVCFWQNRFAETGDIDRKSEPGSRGKRCTTEKEDRAIVRAVRSDAITTRNAITGINRLKG